LASGGSVLDSERVVHARDGLIWGFVLPHTEHLPSRVVESSVHVAVTFDVALEFPRPEIAVRPRIGGMFWTAMPKAPIEEDGESPSRKCDVYPDRELAAVHEVVLAKT
jgi:hypothetical protein